MTSSSGSQSIHFIAIGGSAMHNLAIALHNKGFHVTGSDDEIMEPSKSRLKDLHLLPVREGWFPEKINKELTAVILGMHARADNPELLKAQELGIKIYSYPEYLFEFSRNKKRVVIGGSHGKTSITAMILHVLKQSDLDFDYMVGSTLDGFDTMVKLTENSPVIILEGDEYLSSPIDRRPKFHLYHADIALLSGIAWDHINVFPVFSNYVEQFQIFVDNIPSKGSLVYCGNDEEVKNVVAKSKSKCTKIQYTIPEYEIINGTTFLKTGESSRTHRNENELVALEIFGAHNLMNLEGARNICKLLGITADQFYRAIVTFKGAAGRLELLAKNDSVSIYKDFAHSPSKLKATIGAVKEQFGARKIIAIMELHTFSSLNRDFLEQYENTMNAADESIVYFNPHTIEHKKLPPISELQVRQAFANQQIKIVADSMKLAEYLNTMSCRNAVIIMMSSGNFDGLNLKQIAHDLIQKSLSEV